MNTVTAGFLIQCEVKKRNVSLAEMSLRKKNSW